MKPVETSADSSCCQRQRSDAGKILKVITDERVAKEIYVEEINYRKERNHKISDGKERWFDAVVFHPKHQ